MASLKGIPPQASVSQVSSFSKSDLGQLGLEIPEDFEDREVRDYCDGDPGDLALQPRRIDRLAVLEGCRLHPRGVEIPDLVSRDHAAGETADPGKIPRARDVARCACAAAPVGGKQVRASRRMSGLAM